MVASGRAPAPWRSPPDRPELRPRGLLVLSRRREVVASVVLGGLAVSVPFGLWLLVGVGPSLVAETLRFTLDYQALRLPVEQRG